MVSLIRQNKKENEKIYKKVSKTLKQNLGNDVPINHVGSTAIPYMYGKNIIDILVGAKDKNEFKLFTEKIINLGYFEGKRKEETYKFFANKKEETKSNDIHIHLSIINTTRYQEFLILKKYLLKNKLERKAYSNLKKEIVKESINRNEYKQKKSKYVEELLNRAKKVIQ